MHVHTHKYAPDPYTHIVYLSAYTRIQKRAHTRACIMHVCTCTCTHRDARTYSPCLHTDYLLNDLTSN